MEREAAFDLLLDRPAETGILSDFDGTLAAIVDHPQDAVPAEGALAAFTSLARSFGAAAVVSGRSLEDLRSRFAPKGVVLLGSYGRERSDRYAARTFTEGWEAIGIAAAARTAGMEGVIVERKGAGVALHFRLAPGRADEVAAVAADLASEFELELRPGRLVVELTAPGPGKGEAVAALVEEFELRSVAYGGDDVADVEAFDALRGCAEAVLVAVRSEEGPDELTAGADLVMPSPHAWVEFLGELARRGARER